MDALLGFPVIESDSVIPTDIQLGNIAAYILVEVIYTNEKGEKKIFHTTLDKLFIVEDE